MRFDRDPRNERKVATRIDHLEGVIRDHINEDLIPRVSEHHRISVETDPVEFLYFSRLTYGRLCSCWAETDAEPDDGCPICYGTGYVTGFKKWGCVWECLDVTAPCTTVNLAPNFELQSRPTPWMLINGAYRGSIEWRVELKNNTGKLDALKLGAYTPRGTKVELFVREDSEPSYTQVTKSNAISAVESRLLDEDDRPTVLWFKVKMTASPQAKKQPRFTYLHFRYRTKLDDELYISIDIPRDNESITLTEMGIHDSWQVLQLVFGKKLPNLQTRDFFVRRRDGRRWKLTELTPFRPEGHLVGYDGTARLVQAFEPYANVPI